MSYEGYGGNHAWYVLRYFPSILFTRLRKIMEKVINISGFWIENQVLNLLNVT
jgi:hypothetical protein